MANFDLILLALIAVFIFLRLRSVLGSKDGNEENRNHRDMFNPDPMDDDDDRNERDNVIHLPGSYREEENQQEQKPAVKEIEPVGPVQKALADIMSVDPTFEQHAFLDGARGAFEMILTAYAQKDRETLKNLLTQEVYQNFEAALDAREAAGERLETTLIGINSVEITEADFENNTAEITVRFVSEQVNVTYDSDNEVVDGDSNYIDTVTDIWTFERDVSSNSPIWFLKATEAE